MRPLELAVEGFTCFKERQSPLDLRGLHLLAIAGPTGSGKSSLLDAMIFALFGKVPRLKRQISELISLGKPQLSVRLDFTVGQGTYRVVRIVHRARPTLAVLEQVDPDAEVDAEPLRKLAEGVRQVDERVRGLLGLDYETFTRAVVLPQGQFAAFLESQPSKQREILRDLLRLHVYEAMRFRASAEARRLETQVEADERRLREDYADATADHLGQRRREVQALKDDLSVSTKALAEARTAETATRHLRERSRELETRRRDLAGLAEQSVDVETLATRLAAARKAAPLLPRLETVARLERDLAEYRTVVDREAQALAVAEKALEAAREALAKARDASAEIPGLRARVQALDGVVALLGPRAKAIERSDAAERRTAEADRRAAEIVEQRAAAEASSGTLRAELNQAHGAVDAAGYDPDLERRLDGVRDTAGRLRDRRSALGDLGEQVEDAEGRRRRAEAQRVEATADVAAAEQRAQTSQEALGRAEEAWHAARHENHVDLLRRDLEPGAPCPVCQQDVGEVPEHGTLTDAALERLDALAAEVETARAQAEEHRRRLESDRAVAMAAASELDTARRRADELRAEATDAARVVGELAADLHTAVGKDVEDDAGDTVEARVLAAVDRVAKAREVHRQAQERREALAESVAAAERTLERLADEGRAAEQRRDESRAALEVARAEADDYTAKIRRVTEADDPAEERRGLAERIDTLEATERRATEQERQRAVDQQGASERHRNALDDLERTTRHLEQNHLEVDQALADAGFDDAEVARAAALDDAEQGELDRRIRDHEKALHGLETRIADLEAELDGEFVNQEAMDAAEAKVRQLTARERDERDRLAALEGALDDLEQRVQRRVGLEQGLEGVRGERRVMRELERELRSDRFQAYLLEKIFQDLVHGASLRLYELTQERYQLTFEEGQFRVIDGDNANQRRSTDTLSGGETFLASLALALELSEQVQREAGAVTLGSIFIDEGFGTLDPETLDIVAGAIESLPRGGRMVGIITHIPELTRRLPFRVLVDKSPAGSRYRVDEE